MASTGTTFDTDCVLMLHMDGADASTTFTDSELNTAKTVTANGNAQIDTAQSKFGGASGLFDGSGDYLTVPDSADWDFGTGDFTIDFWVRFNSFTSDDYFVSVGNYTDGIAVQYVNPNTLRVWTLNSFDDFSWTVSTATWYHIAVTRSGTTMRAFVDGTSLGSVSNSDNLTGSTAGVYIASRVDGSDQFDGWIDELRIVKGTAVWTANFTPASAAYTPPITVTTNYLKGRSRNRAVFTGVSLG